MEFKFENNTAIYVQLMEQIRLKILSGELEPGERLLSVRDLALAAKVNPNTMQKALSELEELGWIKTERTNGKFVTTDQNFIAKQKKFYALEISQKYLSDMARIGYDTAQIFTYLDKIGEHK